jgi:hypothetical protein
VAAGRDGRAYVLAHRRGLDRSGGTHRVHRVDLGSGTVTGSAALPGTASSLAVPATGDRVFVAMDDRILTLSTARRLAVSWHYRSPGPNSALAFAPGGGLLFAARGPQVAVFDSRLIAARGARERQARDDDATAVLPLPFAATSLLVSDDGRLLAASGAGRELAVIDAAAVAPLPAPVPASDSPATERFLPIGFSPAGGLTLAAFPGAAIVNLAAPDLPPPPVAVVPAPARPVPATEAGIPPPEDRPPENRVPEDRVPEDRVPATGTPPAGSPAPEPRPGETPGPGRPRGPVPEPRPAAAAVLRGRLTGDLPRDVALVVYGPDSIVREHARVLPDPDGAWEVPLPPAGVYRIVPKAPGARPLRTVPNFHTVRVMQTGIEGIDFALGPAAEP